MCETEHGHVLQLNIVIVSKHHYIVKKQLTNLLTIKLLTNLAFSKSGKTSFTLTSVNNKVSEEFCASYNVL